MSFMDKLKKKAEELDLETKARQLQESATQAAKQARVKPPHARSSWARPNASRAGTTVSRPS